MKTQKTTLVLMALIISLSQILLTSCGSSNKVVSSSFIQKRKYTKGYHFDFASKKNVREIKKELTVANYSVMDERDLYASNQGALNADNNVGVEQGIYIAQEKIIPEIILKKKHAAAFSEPALKKNEIKNDTGSIIVTKKGDTISCKIVRETSERIYYLKNEVVGSSGPAADRDEHFILRKDVASYSWDVNAEQANQIKKKLNQEVEKRKLKTAKRFANASFNFSLLGILCFFLSLLSFSAGAPGLFAFLFFMLPICAILGIILGIISLSHFKNISNEKKGKTLAVIGILLGIIEVSFIVLVIYALSTLTFSIAF